MAGQPVAPYFRVGFETMAQLGSVSRATPWRRGQRFSHRHLGRWAPHAPDRQGRRFSRQPLPAGQARARVAPDAGQPVEHRVGCPWWKSAGTRLPSHPRGELVTSSCLEKDLCPYRRLLDRWQTRHPEAYSRRFRQHSPDSRVRGVTRESADRPETRRRSGRRPAAWRPRRFRPRLPPPSVRRRDRPSRCAPNRGRPS